MEWEKREQTRKNIIKKEVNKKENNTEDVRRIGKEIGVEMDIEEIKKQKTGREKKGGSDYKSKVSGE